jgi:hypothetical protein
VQQHQVEAVGPEPAERSLDRRDHAGLGEVERRSLPVERLADLGGHDEVVAVRLEEGAEALLAHAVRGGGVDEVHAQVAGVGQESGGLVVGGEVERRGVLEPGGAAELDRAERDRADVEPGGAEGAGGHAESVERNAESGKRGVRDRRCGLGGDR